MLQLRLSYEVVNDRRVKQSDIRYYVPQSQGSSVDCGPFAVANTVCILNNVESASVVLHQRHMRSHIFKCLYNNLFVMFPHSNILQENKSEKLSNKTGLRGDVCMRKTLIKGNQPYIHRKSKTNK